MTTATCTRSNTPVARFHAADSGSLRLTRRGRVVLLLALVTLTVVAFTLGRVGTSSAATETPSHVPYASTTVHAGETLWSVAKRVAPGHDPRDVVAKLQQLNHLRGGAVQVGQQLLLPRAA